MQVGLTLSPGRVMRRTEWSWFSVILWRSGPEWQDLVNGAMVLLLTRSKAQVKAESFMSLWCSMGCNDSWEDATPTAARAVDWDMSPSSHLQCVHFTLRTAGEPSPCIRNLCAGPVSIWWPNDYWVHLPRKERIPNAIVNYPALLPPCTAVCWLHHSNDLGPFLS